jgi:hypothetical protein
MITKYKKETLKEAINDEDVLYSTTSLIADKLRAIYTLFGWVHMLENFDMAQEVIEELIMNVFKAIDKDGKTHQNSTAGMMIEGWFDEDGFVNLEYYFNLE